MTRAKLDPNLQQAVATGTPVELVDPATNQVFYLVSAEQFQTIANLAGDHDATPGYPLVDAIMANDDVNDPLLGSYQ
jgi:hypothetical protein